MSEDERQTVEVELRCKARKEGLGILVPRMGDARKCAETSVVLLLRPRGDSVVTAS